MAMIEEYFKYSDIIAYINKHFEKCQKYFKKLSLVL